MIYRTNNFIHSYNRKTMPIKDIAKWLKTAPRKSEVVEIQNGKDKVKIIPQKIIESLLDELTEQNWSTRNFQFSRWTEQGTYPAVGTGGNASDFKSARTMCDASLELVVTYRMMVDAPLHDGTGPLKIEKEVTRVLVGAVSFDVSFFGNDHIANTAKSLAISNAASDLGRRFGKDLNPKEASMMILGMKQPVKIPIPPGEWAGGKYVPDEEVKGKIGETLTKLTGDLTTKK